MSSDNEGEYGPSHMYPTPDEAMKPYTFPMYCSHVDDTEEDEAMKPYAFPMYCSHVDDIEEDESEDPFLYLAPNEGEDGDDEQGEDSSSEIFNLEAIFTRMDQIDLNRIDGMLQVDHDKEIRSLIGDELSDIEKSSLEITKDWVENTLSSLPVNEEVLQAIEKDEDTREAIRRYRGWVAEILDSMVLLALASGAHLNLPVDMRGWLLFLRANAHRDSRERIIQVLTNISVVSACIQYACGQLTWGPDMFDAVPRINLEDPGAVGDAVTAYLAVGHKSAIVHYLYSGSATNINAMHKEIGEELRMIQHARILALGKQEIQRQRSMGKPNVFRVHECLADTGEGGYFFIPQMRLPVDISQPGQAMSATLALLSETINMVLLGTHSMESVPRRGRAVQFMLHTDKLMKKFRPQNCPAPPWSGTNKVLPLLQMPRSIWNLLREGHRLAPRHELFQRLREHFKRTQDLALSEQECKDFLKADNRSFARHDICTLRRLYATVLNEHGLAYKTDYQAFLYTRCVLWCSIIAIAEKGLVWLLDGKYHLEIGSLDWVKVSEVAQNIAPVALAEKFTRVKCMELYHDIESVRFNQHVLFPAAWEKLREGIPDKFAYSRAKLQFPKPVRIRIQDVCRHVLFVYMTQQKCIHRSPSLVTLTAADHTKVDHLQTQVLCQLKEDVNLSNSVQTRAGAWEDVSFIRYIVRELKVARKEVQQGLSLAEADRWSHLCDLLPGWAHSLPSANVTGNMLMSEIEVEHYLDPRLQEPQPTDIVPVARQDFMRRMQSLQEKQVEPDRLSGARNRVGPKGSGLGSRSGDEPFDLCDDNGTPLSMKVFTIQRERKRKTVKTQESKPAPAAAPAASGVCDHCGTVWKDLPTHMPYCLRRCESCEKDQRPCVRHPEDPLQCLHCKSKGTKCSNSPQVSQIKTSCPRCWCMHLVSDMADHVADCHGRCTGCVEGKVPCIAVENGTRQCGYCENTGHKCLSFSHDHLFPEKEQAVCDRCLGPVTYRGHKSDCIGQCSSCRQIQQPCIRSRPYPARCDYCEAQELDCSDFSHLIEKRVRKKVFCKHCLRDDVFPNHVATCKGRCKGCVLANRPCVRAKGDGSKCKGCKTQAECGEYDNEDNLAKGTCESCGKEFLSSLLKTHTKNCQGKCSHCQDLGTPCERQGREKIKPCKQCEKDGVGYSCDGFWKK